MIKQSIIDYRKKRDLEKEKRLNIINLRNRFLVEWTSSILGLSQLQIKNYINLINDTNNKNDFKKIIKKIQNDFFKENINISYTEIQFKVKEFELKANIISENKFKLESQRVL